MKNVNRYRRRMRKAGVSVPALIPVTFVLPQVTQLGCHTAHTHTQATDQAATQALNWLHQYSRQHPLFLPPHPRLPVFAGLRTVC